MCFMTCWDIRHCPAVSPEEVNSQRPNLCCVVVCNCQLLGDRVGSDPYSKHPSAYMEEVKFQRPNLCCVVACNYQLLGDCVGKDFYSKYADIAWHSPIPPSPSLLFPLLTCAGVAFDCATVVENGRNLEPTIQ